MLMAMTNESNAEQRIRVSDGVHAVVFVLNETSASRSFYEMLPFEVKVSNYSNNEKVFDPPRTISYGTDCIEGECPVGTIALFSPWGNVAMYYGPAPRWSGLYLMGRAVEGTDNIRLLSGTIRVEAVDGTSGVDRPTEKPLEKKAFSPAGTLAVRKGVVIESNKKYIKKK